MAIKASKIIVVDIECTCWSPARPRDMEIIEVGVCLFDGLTGEIDRKKSYIVRPDLLEISDFCAELTGITESRIRDEGAPLHEVINRMRKEYPLRNRGWASWGLSDKKHFFHECRYKNIEYPFTYEHINIKYLLSLWLRQAKGMGLTKALQTLHMKFEGRPHSGADDAYNAARILKVILGHDHVAMT